MAEEVRHSFDINGDASFSRDGSTVSTDYKGGEKPKGSDLSDKINELANKGDSSVVKGLAERKYREQEFKTLEGTLTLAPGFLSHNLNVGEVITLVGLTPFLNGNYYITQIDRDISASGGYSLTLSVVKTTFMDNIKQESTDSGRPKVITKETKKKKPKAKKAKSIKKK